MNFNKYLNKYHKSYTYILGFSIIFILSLIYIENLAKKNEGRNLPEYQANRFIQTQSYNFEAKTKIKKIKKNISISEKKSNFIKSLYPVIKGSNNSILEQRKIVFNIEKKIKNNNLNVLEAAILKKLFKEYKIKNNDISELKKRIDIVPISLAIAQAAIESGWGTSRFALEGNAYYGQKIIGKEVNGISPSEISNPKIKVRVFDNLNDSVDAYIKNLNTHFAYKNFRKSRVQLRSLGKKLQGIDLVNELNKYSEKGHEYVLSVKKIIEENNLEKFDFVEYQSAQR
tara:strand:- start:6 stop:860 length:855 start_codon:yes stop_codon:yes gene_type:complete